MTNIPFPNPHESNALNDYLDDLAAGKQAIPESDVEAAAQAFHHLASRAEVKPPTQQSVESTRGEETMHTTPLAAPVSNRTRRQMAAREEKSGRSYGWLSAVIVAGLLISMIGAAWLNREPGNPHENLAWAPGTATAIAEDETLTPESAPWIADFDPAECTETSGLSQVTIDYQAMPNFDPQGYGVIGPADEASANEIVNQYRAMRGCESFTDAWAYWSDARINQHPRVFDDNAREEVTELQEYFTTVYPDQFMEVAEDITVDGDVQSEWAARVEAEQLGLPVPLDAKINPTWGVELSDGRIAFPATVMYSADDPAITANGLPVDSPASTVAMVFTLEEGRWKYDDSLQLCLVNCENGVGNPLDPAHAAWAQQWETRTCTPQQLLMDVVYVADLSQIDYSDRQYAPVGPAEPDAASIATETVVGWNSCNGLGGISTESMSFMTPLGMVNFELLSTGSSGDPFITAPYFRQWDTGNRELVSQSTSWNQVVVIDEPIRTSIGGMMWNPQIDGSGPNVASVSKMQQGFNPATATELIDGRITIFAVPTVALEDRGAVTYEGNQSQQQVSGVTLIQHGDRWLVDELVVTTSGVMLLTQLDQWWWDAAFDDDPVATPQSVEPTPTTVPRGGDNRG